MAAHASNRTPSAVLQFDTGMSRFGIPPQERADLATALSDTGNVKVPFIMSHLASADELDDAQNSEQFAEMRRIADEFAGFAVSFANSGGVFLGDAYHGVLARPGIALNGGRSTAGNAKLYETGRQPRCRGRPGPHCPAGDKGWLWRSSVTQRKTRLATIAAGYADGLPRSLSGRGAVYHQGTRLPIVGRVSMDSIAVDVSALPEDTLTLGSLVEVIGSHQTLEDVARDAGTISHEILTGLGHRYHRQYR